MKKMAAFFLAFLLFLPLAKADELPFVIRRGDENQKKIAITVDDCARIDMVQAIFELGQELDIPMTFFTLGYVLKEEDREVWRTIAESNCEIGNHCYWHYRLPEQSQNGVTRLLERTQEQLDLVLGYHYPMQVMRPPFGRLWEENGSIRKTRQGIEKAGYDHAIMWTLSQTDPKKCLKGVGNGTILLFHTIPKDLKCLQEVLPVLKDRGYEFVTVSEMLGKPPVQFVKEEVNVNE